MKIRILASIIWPPKCRPLRFREDLCGGFQVLRQVWRFTHPHSLQRSLGTQLRRFVGPGISSSPASVTLGRGGGGRLQASMCHPQPRCDDLFSHPKRRGPVCSVGRPPPAVTLCPHRPSGHTQLPSLPCPGQLLPPTFFSKATLPPPSAQRQCWRSWIDLAPGRMGRPSWTQTLRDL